MRHRQSLSALTLTCLATVLAMLLTCPFAYTSAGMCQKNAFVVEINIGHDKNHKGAISACGIPEYEFNVAAAQTLAKELSMRGFGVRLTTGITRKIDTTKGTRQKKQPSLLVSLHHDSVQPQYLSTWICNGSPRFYSDEYSGYSIFYSTTNRKPAESLLYATMLGTQMLKQGLTPTLHHAAQTPGENRDLIDSKRGIYIFDTLRILNGSKTLAVLLECGIIVNRKDEQTILTEQYRHRIATAIVDSIEEYCNQMANHKTLK